MPAYIVLVIDIEDHDAFTEYARLTAPTMAAYGGKIALRGPIVDIVEGDFDAREDTRLVVAEFASLERARAWWESPEYRPLVELRQPPVARTRALFIDGINLDR